MCTGRDVNGGKHRRISWEADTGAILSEYLEGYRAQVIAKAKAKNPSIKVPDNLFIYEQRGIVRPYRKTAMDNILKRLGSRIGTDFSNHDLRRTCGRMMY